MIRVLSRDFVKCMMTETPFSIWESTTNWNGFPNPDGPLESLVSAIYFPDWATTTKTYSYWSLSSMPTSLYPTSNYDLVHPVKSSLYDPPSGTLSQPGRISLIIHGRSQKKSGWWAGTTTTEKSGYVQMSLIQDNWAIHTTFWTTLPKYCETSSEGKSDTSQILPNLDDGYFT